MHPVLTQVDSRHGSTSPGTTPAQVRSLFGWQSLEVWAVGPSTAFHLHVPKLWARIIPGKCSVKSNTKSKKLYVRLYKERDAEWRYLKGF